MVRIVTEEIKYYLMRNSHISAGSCSEGATAWHPIPSKDDNPASFARVRDELIIPEGISFTQLVMAPSAYIAMFRTVGVDFVVVAKGEVVVETFCAASTEPR